MIYEYAVDPEVIAEWIISGEFLLYKEFSRQKGRIFVRVFRKASNEKSLKREVFDFIRKKGHNPDDFSEILEEMEKLWLGGHSTWRTGMSYDGKKNWIDNVVAQDKLQPFDVIVASKDKLQSRRALDLDYRFRRNNAYELWERSSHCTVRRNADDMSKLVGTMLSSASQIYFVDPHFDECLPRFQNSFKAFFRQILKNRQGATDNLDVCVFKKYQENEVGFKKELLEEIVPKGLKVSFYALDVEMHNRYILTNMGGVSFHHGLDESKGNVEQTDDVTRLSDDCLTSYLSCHERKAGKELKIREEIKDVLGTAGF